jgi:hypothetical protein
MYVYSFVHMYVNKFRIYIYIDFSTFYLNLQSIEFESTSNIFFYISGAPKRLRTVDEVNACINKSLYTYVYIHHTIHMYIHMYTYIIQYTCIYICIHTSYNTHVYMYLYIYLYKYKYK